MAFVSMDDIISEIAAGKIYRMPFIKVVNTGATSAASRWHEALAGVGTGGPMTLTGSAGVGVALSSATAGCIPLNSDVTPDTRNLVAMSAITPATTMVPGYIILTDLLYMYPSCVVTTGAGTTLNNGASKPTRHNSGIGAMVSAFVVGAVGATSPIITMTYINSTPTGSRTGYLRAPMASSIVGLGWGGGTAASPVGPYMEMNAGDSGVSELTSYSTASGTTGTVTFIIHRPIATIPIVLANTAGERDFLFGTPTLPKIDDGACLGMMVLIGGALTAGQVICGELAMAWG